MADFDSSLPIRTQNPGDVAVKLTDALNTANQLAIDENGAISANISAEELDIRPLEFASDKVDASGSSVEISNASLEVTATDLDMRDLAFESDKVDASGSLVNVGSIDATVTVQATDLDMRDLAFATDKVDASGSSVEISNASLTVEATDLDMRDLAFATDKVDVSGSSVSIDNWNDAELDMRDLVFETDKVDVSGSSVSISNASLTVEATDLDVRDLSSTQDSIKIGNEDGDAFAGIFDGALRVVLPEGAGRAIDFHYDAASAIAAGSSSTHECQAEGFDFQLRYIEASASGKMKIEVKLEDGDNTGVFNTVLVAFNSAASPNISLEMPQYLLINENARIQVVKTNLDTAAQDMYSTIMYLNN